MLITAKLKPSNGRKNPSNVRRFVEHVELKDFSLQIDVGTATQTAVRRNDSFGSTDSMNLQIFLREFLRFGGLSFAVYVN